MDGSVDHVACCLLALGLQRGDRIGVLGLIALIGCPTSWLVHAFFNLLLAFSSTAPQRNQTPCPLIPPSVALFNPC